MEFWHFVRDASPFSQGILALLVLLSVVSWGLILERAIAFRRMAGAGRSFASLALDCATLHDLLELAPHHPAAPAARMLEEAHRRLEAPGGGTHAPAAWERQFLSHAQAEAEAAERGLTFLATVSSASPFIGLLGTVWGVMVAFLRIGSHQGAAMLEVVGPGIAEALIATVAGLATAIPATMAYNAFQSAARNNRRRLEDMAGQALLLAEGGKA